MQSKWFLVTLLPILLVSCASADSKSGTKPPVDADGNEVIAASRLIPAPEDVPSEVRAIESEIDKSSVILADRFDVFVSKNYQFDVSLIGDVVTNDLDTGAANERVARGKSIAFVRNLQLRADHGIRVRIAGAGTVPFIRIRGSGHCSHIQLAGDGDRREVTRAHVVIIDNRDVAYYQEGEIPAAMFNDRTP